MRVKVSSVGYKKLTPAFLFVVIVFSIFFIPQPSFPSSFGGGSNNPLGGDHAGAVPGEYIVKFKEGVAGERGWRSLREYRGRVEGEVPRIGVVKVKVADQDKGFFLERVRRDPNILWVEPNYIITVEATVNDPLWGNQWGPRKVKADLAWDVERGVQDVLVVVVDTGILYTHPDLESNYVPGGYDWVNNDDNPIDDNGHGTHCAGIVAAVANNSVGVAGLAQVKIMAEKFLSSSGSGSAYAAAQAIVHAVDVGKAISNRIVLSCSWGSSSSSLTIENALRYAYENGALIVAAAGNSASSNPFYPAAYPMVISVTAIDSSDQLASFSNYGSTVDMAAPGVSILSTYLNNGYTYMSGTSMACPFVSGAAALVWSRFPSYTNEQVRETLQTRADDLGSAGWDEYYGYGRVNLQAALQGLADHDLRVNKVETAPLIFPGDTVTVTGTVQNLGANPETGLTVGFYVNSILADAGAIPQIPTGGVVSLSFQWTPLTAGTYNLTLYVAPVPGEEVVQNNAASESVTVQVKGEILVVSDDDGAYHWTLGTSVDEFVSTLTSGGYSFNVWTEATHGRPSLTLLSRFKIVIWTCGDYWNYAVDSVDASTLTQYVQGGGKVILEGQDVAFNHVNDDFLTNVAHAQFIIDNAGSSGITVTNPTHPVARSLPTSTGWTVDPPWEDGVRAANGGVEVVAYQGTLYGAVIAYSGDRGAAVFIAFPLGCLPSEVWSALILNCVEWMWNRYTVRITVNPEVTGVKAYVDAVAYWVPASATVTGGTHRFTVWPSYNDGDVVYVFDHWEDESQRVVGDQLSFNFNVQGDLAFTAVFKPYSPGRLALEASDLGYASRGSGETLTVTVMNLGDGPVYDVVVKLIHPSMVEAQGPQPTRVDVSSIPPGGSVTLTWSLTFQEAGTMRMYVAVSGRDEGGNPTACLMRLKVEVEG